MPMRENHMHHHNPDTETDIDRDFLPGLGKGFLTRLYDPVTRVIGVRSAHRPLVDQAGLRAGHRVLEIGCGTANVVLEAKRGQPQAEVCGLDPDSTMLARARRKADREGLAVEFTRGYAEDLPYPDATFDRVLSAFMFHHLGPEVRLAALREVRRVLRPGGSLHLLDFGGTRDPSDGRIARMMQRNERLRDNYDGRIPELMTRAGLVDAGEVTHRRKAFGRVTYYRGHAPLA
jgi:ubiquinone/menaquinone biosynthesis C-methylase UbiE